MSNAPTTPRTKTSFAPTTPATARVSANVPHAVHSSPHYATTRRHSLYGVEDRVVIDPGSRIWKVGFSGEGRPRDVFYGGGSANAAPFWKLMRAENAAERAEEEKLLEARLRTCLRSVFHDSLLADPKARKVILVEHPLLPLYIKEIIARILFENQVPSVSFACSHLLSLLAVGRITGLVIDCGHLESVALPIFAARPMFPQIQTTPIAGAQLTSHIRALLLMFATYLPPPSSLSAAISVPAANRSTRVPQEVLTDAVVEEIKTRCCFVGHALGPQSRKNDDSNTRGRRRLRDRLPTKRLLAYWVGRVAKRSVAAVHVVVVFKVGLVRDTVELQRRSARCASGAFRRCPQARLVSRVQLARCPSAVHLVWPTRTLEGNEHGGGASP